MFRELSPELAQIAKTELNENPKQTPDDVRNLKEWILKQPHLKARTGNFLVYMKFLLSFSFHIFVDFRSTCIAMTLDVQICEKKFFCFNIFGFYCIFSAYINITSLSIITIIAKGLEVFRVKPCNIYYLYPLFFW